MTLPLFLVFGLSYAVRADSLNKRELLWMLAGNGLYYLIAIPLAFFLQDRRAFCKIACPVALVMKVPARFAAIRIAPTGKTCTRCGRCNRVCPMDVDVRGYISRGSRVASTECILCGECRLHCPAGAI